METLHVNIKPHLPSHQLSANPTYHPTNCLQTPPTIPPNVCKPHLLSHQLSANPTYHPTNCLQTQTTTPPTVCKPHLPSQNPTYHPTNCLQTPPTIPPTVCKHHLPSHQLSDLRHVFLWLISHIGIFSTITIQYERADILSVNEKLPVSKFRYFGKYMIQLMGYCYVHVSGQRKAVLER